MGDMVLLKVLPIKGVRRFGKKGNLGFLNILGMVLTGLTNRVGIIMI